jgi:hypothetical protein
MIVFHKNLTKEKWQKLSFEEQMANVGAEIGRAINWREKDPERSRACFDRGLELLDLTIEDPKNHARPRLKELCRLREILADYFYFDNSYKSTDQQWNSYFMNFNYLARINK